MPSDDMTRTTYPVIRILQCRQVRHLAASAGTSATVFSSQTGVQQPLLVHYVAIHGSRRGRVSSRMNTWKLAQDAKPSAASPGHWTEKPSGNEKRRIPITTNNKATSSLHLRSWKAPSFPTFRYDGGSWRGPPRHRQQVAGLGVQHHRQRLVGSAPNREFGASSP